MDTLLVFIPNNIIHDSPGLLLGSYKKEGKTCRRSIYVYNTKVTCNAALQSSPEKLNNIVGCYSNDLGHCKVDGLAHLLKIWLCISCFQNEIKLVSWCIQRKQQPLDNSFVIIYDKNCLIKSELFLLPSHTTHVVNHFKILFDEIQRDSGETTGLFFPTITSICNKLVLLFEILNRILLKISVISKYSLLAVHFQNYCQTVLWIVSSYKEKRKISIKVGNCLSSIVTDIILGYFVFCTVNKWTNSGEMFDSLSFCTESVIDSINHLVKWLMGSPAGLKLNEPLSNLLGSLVLYYLEIWLSFLNLVRPILEICFEMFMRIGLFGLTFQMAVCADIFAIISFHIYCIYIYAARLYEIQVKGLYSLSRLFLGQKRNPEPGKVDSCPYSTEELLVGTISFAILLFLFPTTLVYYVVFAVMRLGISIISGSMTRSIYYIFNLPLYTTFLWCFIPSFVATTITLTPIANSKNTPHGSLVATPTNSSWLETITLSVPNALSPPGPIKISDTVSNFLVGKFV